jgi:hypothetical protein
MFQLNTFLNISPWEKYLSLLSIVSNVQVPAFEGADGTKLFECLAIAFYRNAPCRIMFSHDDSFIPVLANYAEITMLILITSFFSVFV